MGRQVSNRYRLSERLPGVLRVVAVVLFALACVIIMMAASSDQPGPGLTGAGMCLLIALCALLAAELLEMIRDVANNSFEQLEILRSANRAESATGRADRTVAQSPLVMAAQPRAAEPQAPAPTSRPPQPPESPPPKQHAMVRQIKCPNCGSMLKIGAGQKITRGTRATCSKCGTRVRLA